MKLYPLFRALFFAFSLISLAQSSAQGQSLVGNAEQEWQPQHQVRVVRYWIQFPDKGPDTQAKLHQKSSLLKANGWTDRSLERRERLGISIDFLDLPVYQPYLSALSSVEGLTIRSVSRWLNAASVEVSNPELLSNLSDLAFVEHIQPVSRFKVEEEPIQFEFTSTEHQSSSLRSGSLPLAEPGVPGSVNQWSDDLEIYSYSRLNHDEFPSLDYGQADFQVAMLRVPYLHQLGYRGAGMLIGVFDAGWRDADILPQFERLRSNNGIADVWNFYKNNDSVYEYSNHGTAVLSTMAGFLNGEYAGTAPDARFALYLTEVEEFERIIEEDFWLAAAERADMQGVDVINTSLGYTTFDDIDSAFNHTYADMDGQTTIISRAANWAASRGMLVVTSAGNQGNSAWKYIGAPADADSALAIGAVDAFGQYVNFSSVGPSADGDVKPNVSAVGFATAVIGSSGTVGFGSGTSFASPLVCGSAACLWQAFPEKSNMEIFRAIQESANQYQTPDSLLGYGIPDFTAAYYLLAPPDIDRAEDDLSIFPNPVGSSAMLYLGPTWSTESGTIEIVHAAGSLVRSYDFSRSQAAIGVFQLSRLDDLASGIYILQVRQEDRTAQIKILKD